MTNKEECESGFFLRSFLTNLALNFVIVVEKLVLDVCELNLKLQFSTN